MNSLKMSCPSCHNTLQVPEDITRLNCMHCGAELYVQKGEGFAALKQITDKPEPENSRQKKVSPPDKRKRSPLTNIGIIIAACIFLAALSSILSNGSESDRSTSASSEARSTSQTDAKSDVESTRTVIASTPNTATNTPTKTPIPTKTPTPAPVAAGVVLSNSNLRGGPGTSFDVVGSVSKEDELEIFGRSEDGAWLKISRTEPTWIWAEFVELSVDIDEIPVPPSPTPTSSPTATPSPNATATNRAVAQSAASTARAQGIANTTATIEAYAASPPVGSWCDTNGVRAVCVGGFEYRRSIGYSSASANSRYIAFVIRVDNFDDGNISVNPFDITLVLENGKTYSHDVTTYNFSNSFDGVTIAPGDNAQGAIVFLVQNNVAPERVIYRGGLFEPDIVINLKDEPRTE